MFDTRTRLFFFACLKDAAGAALKNAAPAPGSDQQKNRLRLRNTGFLKPFGMTIYFTNNIQIRRQIQIQQNIICIYMYKENSDWFF